jgi:hypothetical protein
MQNGKVSLVLLVTLTLSIHAQMTQRCEWHFPQHSDTVTHEWKDGYNRSHYFTSIFEYAEPVSLDSLDGLTFNVPSNVTRIKRTGLAFAADPADQGGGADLIFMIDGSGSMWWGSESDAVITYEGDTLYRVKGGDQGGFPVGRVVKEVQGYVHEFDLYCCSDRNDLYRVPGDPFYESWGMMKETIILQRDLVTNAYAGFMPFAGQYHRENDPGSGAHPNYTQLANVSKGHPDAIQNLMSLWHLGRNELDDRPLPGPPLPLSKTRKAQWTAIQWGLEDAMEELQTMGQTENRAVIAFSDGEIHDAAEQYLDDATIASYPYPFYSIALIEPRYDSNFTVSRITEGTGGEHFLVKPGDQDSLARIMQRIIGKVTKVKIPVEVELINNSLSPVQRSHAANWGFEKTPDGKGWGVTLDSVLALAEGVNNLTFNVVYEDGETGVRETRSASFVVNVGGGQAQPGFTTCYNAASLAMRAETGRTTRINPEEDHNFELTLTNSAFDLVGRMNTMEAYTAVLGDMIEIEMDDTIAKDSSNFPYESFTKSFGYNGMASSADTSDMTIQSAEEDTLVFRWEHPRDPRDTATLIVPTDDGSLIPPTADPAPNKYVQATLGVSLIDQNPGVDPSLRYSIDGGGYQNFAGSIQLQGVTGLDTFTIRAFATAPDYKNSDTVSFVYIIEIPKLTPPTASPPGGSHEGATLAVTLGQTNAGASDATIYYSIDNGAFQAYALPLQLDAGATGASHTVRAYVQATGYLNSDTVSFSYTQTLPKLLAPTAAPAAGTYEQATLSVTLSDPNTGANAVMYYSIDGGGFAQYSAALSLDAGATGATHTVRAFASATGYLNSDTISLEYTQTLPTLDAPSASPNGGEYKGAQQVSLSHAEAGVTIVYTLDGTDPKTSSSAVEYSAPFTIDQAGATTLKAYARKSGFIPSAVLTVTFTNTDSEGPFVTRALYYLGNLPGQSGPERPDTLKVRFNEAVRCDEINGGSPASWLRFIDNGTENGAVLNGGSIASCGGSAQEITIILPNKGVSPIDDSLAAAEGALYDPYGNQSPRRNAVAVEWGRGYDIYAIAHAIFHPDEPIPLSAADFENAAGKNIPTTGTAIQITSVKPLLTEQSYGRIYDPVGNLVAGDLPVLMRAGDQSEYWVLWNGKNASGRTVGSGNYLAVLSLKQNDGTTIQSRKNLGVKNPQNR